MFPHKVFEKITKITEYTIEERFNSKKNEVFKVKYFDGNMLKRVVVKNYLQPPMNMENEIYFLTELNNAGVPVPKIYFSEDRCVIMEYIEGKTLIDALDEGEKNSERNHILKNQAQKYLLEDLVNWLKLFYYNGKKITGNNIILMDIHLRNFIIDKNLVGVDFENCLEGRIEEDIGKLCAFIVTYDPPWTQWKTELMEGMIEKTVEVFSLDPEILMSEIDKELISIEKRRRGLKYMSNSK